MWKDSTGNPIAFYHEATANVIKAVVDIFSDVYIVRRDPDGNIGVDKKGFAVKPHRVPIRYQGKDAYVQAYQVDNKVDRRIDEVLPAMGLVMPRLPQISGEGIRTDPMAKHCLPACDGEVTTMFSGTPMSFSFELTLRANKEHELYNMYETIISRIGNPIFKFSIIEALGVRRDITLSNIATDWSIHDTEFPKGKNSRPIEAIIAFDIAPVYFYSPVTTQGTIKKITLNFINECNPEVGPLVTDTWTVDPTTAGPDDPHTLILTQTYDGEQFVLETIPVNIPDE